MLLILTGKREIGPSATEFIRSLGENLTKNGTPYSVASFQDVEVYLSDTEIRITVSGQPVETWSTIYPRKVGQYMTLAHILASYSKNHGITVIDRFRERNSETTKLKQMFLFATKKLGIPKTYHCALYDPKHIANAIHFLGLPIVVKQCGTSKGIGVALAHDAGRATGIVTTGNLTDATPAAFYAHATDMRDTQSIAQQFIQSDTLDIVMGGGMNDFTPESKGGHRKDGRDLWLELRSKDHALVRSKAELENTPAFLSRPLTGIFANGNLAFSSQVESGSQQPSLSDMVRRAIQFLQFHPKGYLLVVDAALVSRAAEQNNGEGVLSETSDFDRAVEVARQFAGEKTLILCVGKNDIGGLSLNGYPLKGDHGVALLGTNAAGYPAITWSTGPNGPRNNDPAIANSGTNQATVDSSLPTTPKEPSAFGAPQAISTARDMIVVGSGPGSELLNGFMDNTEMFTILQKGL